MAVLAADWVVVLSPGDYAILKFPPLSRHSHWGGPIGLINAVAAPDRFARLAILNTWLHHDGFAYTPAIKARRDAATNRHWLAWMRHNLPCGTIVRRTAVRPVVDPVALERAYEAPFDGSIASKAGARRIPWCIPFAEPEAGAADRQAEAFEALKRWSKPVNVIFGDADRSSRHHGAKRGPR